MLDLNIFAAVAEAVAEHAEHAEEPTALLLSPGG